MRELLTSESLIATSTARKRGKVVRHRPILRMAWAADPTTGKLAARWVVVRSELVGTVELASAA
jgi:hypothetical protein